MPFSSGRMAHYGDAEYWERRYSRQSRLFEWYVSWEQMSADVTETVKGLPAHVVELNRFCVLGTGTSLVAQHLYDAMKKPGYPDPSVVASDLSSSAVTFMADFQSKQTVNRPGLQYVVRRADLKSDIAADSVTAVVEKALLDCSLCGSSAQEGQSQFKKILQEVARILAPGGVFVHVTQNKSTEGLKKALFDGSVCQWADVSMVEVDAEPGSDSPSYYLLFCTKP